MVVGLEDGEGKRSVAEGKKEDLRERRMKKVCGIGEGNMSGRESRGRRMSLEEGENIRGGSNERKNEKRRKWVGKMNEE